MHKQQFIIIIIIIIITIITKITSSEVQYWVGVGELIFIGKCG